MTSPRRTCVVLFGLLVSHRPLLLHGRISQHWKIFMPSKILTHEHNCRILLKLCCDLQNNASCMHERSQTCMPESPCCILLKLCCIHACYWVCAFCQYFTLLCGKINLLFAFSNASGFPSVIAIH